MINVKDNMLGEEKIGKLLIKFSIPAIIGMVVNMLYNVVDRMYIGQIPDVGGLAITGVGITMPITSIITGIGMLIGIGTCASLSLAFGSNNKHKAEKIISNGFSAIIVASLSVAVFGNLFAVQILELFGASANTMPFALEYLRPLMFGTICNLLAFGLNHSISSDGNPNIAMFTMIIGAIINIILDPILIFGLDMGIAGAAYATVISQFFAGCWVLFYFFKSKKSTIKIRFAEMKFHKETMVTILQIGMAPFCMQLAGSLVQVVANKSLLTHGGDIAVGAMAVITSVCTIFVMPIFGLNQGAQPIIGYNYGSKNYDRVKKTFIYSLAYGTIFLTVSFIIVQLFPEALIKMFNNDPELTSVALHGVKIYLFSMPIIGIQMASSNFFQAIGKPKHAMFIGLTRQVFFLVPSFLVFSHLWGLEGIWFAGPVADVLAVAVSGCAIIRQFKKMNDGELLYEPTTEAQPNQANSTTID